MTKEELYSLTDVIVLEPDKFLKDNPLYTGPVIYEFPTRTMFVSYLNGKPHNEDGPAHIIWDRNKSVFSDAYFLNGKRIKTGFKMKSRAWKLSHFLKKGT